MIKEVGWNQIHFHGHSNEKVWEEKMTLVELAVDIASFLREHTHQKAQGLNKKSC